MARLLLLLPLAAALQQLNDETFEHQTQAATGMTTGSWFVAFGAKGCEACETALEALESAEEELRESYVIPAHVAKEDSNELWKRFSIKEVPSVLLFAKHRLHRYEGPWEAQSLVAFARLVLDGERMGEPIPAEPSLIDRLWQRFMGGGEL
ncbi:unnamed protein product [Effrenium voratum]|uniref:Thioredoxin domain-containing protein n=1 Tax=Effrenium voratum TaxID=2562239 RepID=A0AA36J4V4_9DINO|nr:unnamed protein product [Effrenium voratum]